MPLSRPSVFEQKKAKILQSLAQPADAYTDASPKGSVDAGIRELIAEINGYAGLVTTSSCAGRVSVFLEGRKRSSSRQGPVAAAASSVTALAGDAGAAAAESGPTGKGGGRWLFVSHEAVDIAGQVTAALGMESRLEGMLVPPDHCSLVHFKFEPMILHILTSSLAEASTVLNAASQAGFRESGAVSILPSKDGSAMPMVAVRSAGLSFDSIVGYQADDGRIVSLVDETYLALLVRLGNERFATNTERISRFQIQLKHLQTKS